MAHSFLQQMDRVPCRPGLEVVQALPPITEALQSFLYSFLPPFTAHCLPLPTLGPDSRDRERGHRSRSLTGKGQVPAEGLQTSPPPLTAAGATVGPSPLSHGLLSGSQTLRPVVLDMRVVVFFSRSRCLLGTCCGQTL